MRDNARQSRGQTLGGMFQGDNRERLPIPAIKDSKHRESGPGRTPDVGQLGRLNSGEMSPLRTLQQLIDQCLGGPNNAAGHLGAAILDANAIPVVAYAPVKRRMNPKFVSAHWQWRPWFRRTVWGSSLRLVPPTPRGSVPPATAAAVESGLQTAVIRCAAPVESHQLCTAQNLLYFRCTAGAVNSGITDPTAILHGNP